MKFKTQSAYSIEAAARVLFGGGLTIEQVQAILEKMKQPTVGYIYTSELDKVRKNKK